MRRFPVKSELRRTNTTNFTEDDACAQLRSESSQTPTYVTSCTCTKPKELASLLFEAAVRRLSPMHEQGEGGSFFHEHVRGQCLCTSRVRVARSSEKNRIQKLDALFSPCQRSESKGLSAVGRLKLASLYLEFLWARGAAEGTSCLRPSPIGLRPLHLDYSSTLSPREQAYVITINYQPRYRTLTSDGWVGRRMSGV